MESDGDGGWIFTQCSKQELTAQFIYPFGGWGFGGYDNTGRGTALSASIFETLGFSDGNSDEPPPYFPPPPEIKDVPAVPGTEPHTAERTVDALIYFKDMYGETAERAALYFARLYEQALLAPSAEQKIQFYSGQFGGTAGVSQ